MIVVDASGAGNHVDLPAAIAAASDGDVLLVKQGTYSGFVVTDKALDIVGEAGAPPEIVGPVRIVNLAATRTVTITGLRVRQTVSPASATPEPAIVSQGNSGAVRLQGLDLQGFDAVVCERRGGHALWVFDSVDVVAARCTVQGGDGGPCPSYGGEGGDALITQLSNVALVQCTLSAGNGGGGSTACGPIQGYGYAGFGGDAVRSYGSTVFASGCTLRGGDGGDGIGWLPAGCGGYGMLALTSSSPSNVRMLDCSVAAGVHGGVSLPFCHTPTPPTFVMLGSTSTVLSGAARQMSAPRVVREQQVLRVDFEGQPGDRVELRFSTRPSHVYSDSWRGVRALRKETPWAALQAGTLDGSGHLSIAWPVDDLGAGVSAQRLFLQAWFIDTSGTSTIGPPATVCLLDSAY